MAYPPHARDNSRQSNFELLRIVAMFLILIEHANFFSIGIPTYESTVLHPVSTWCRYTVQSFALIAVDIYIIISGYFSIKVNTKKVCSFIFLVLFWRIFIICPFLIASSLGLTTYPYTIAELFRLCVPGYKDWFVGAYILLMFLSPMLNAYIEKATLRQLVLFFCLYEGFQVVLSWLLQLYGQFDEGYSVLSFIGLYILGAILRRISSQIISKPVLWYCGVSMAVGSTMFVVARYCSNMGVKEYILSLQGAYNGLFVLFGAFCFFMIFRNLNIRSRVINYIAASSFAVYLFHMHPLMRTVYSSICKYLFANYNTISYLCLISCFIIFVFVTAVLIDLIRRWLWKQISKAKFLN